MIDVSLLKKARHLLADNGWAKHYSYANGKYCAAGALKKAAGLSNRVNCNVPAFEVVPDEICYLNSFTPNGSLVGFNDADWTKKKDVIDLFDAAIENLES